MSKKQNEEKVKFPAHEILFLTHDPALYIYVMQTQPKLLSCWMDMVEAYEKYFATYHINKFIELLPKLGKAFSSYTKAIDYADEIKNLRQSSTAAELSVLGEGAPAKAMEYVLIIMKTLGVEESPLQEKLEYLFGSLCLAMHMVYMHEVAGSDTIMKELFEYFQPVHLNVKACINKVIAKSGCILPPVDVTNKDPLVREELARLKTFPTIGMAKEFISALSKHWYAPLEEVTSEEKEIIEPNYATALIKAIKEIIKNHPSLYPQLRETIEQIGYFWASNPNDKDAQILAAIFERSDIMLETKPSFVDTRKIFKPKRPPLIPITENKGTPYDGHDDKEDDKEASVFTFQQLKQKVKETPQSPSTSSSDKEVVETPVKGSSPLEIGLFATNSVQGTASPSKNKTSSVDQQQTAQSCTTTPS